MNLLAVETSCDETSAAVLRGDRLVANVVSSQMALHARYGGVVPELATREHLRNLVPVVRRALSEAGIGVSQVDWVAATRGPGLPAALQAGFTFAQSLALALDRPCIGIHHHEAHLYSAWASDPGDGKGQRLEIEAFRPHVALIVSGGHTLLVDVEAPLSHRVYGGTIDDAAGECFDKVAKLLGLPYPGGPVLDALAEKGDPTAIAFPRPMLRDDTHDFSFSGLKTSVRTHLARNRDRVDSDQGLCDVCASVRAAVVETLVGKTIRLAEQLGRTCVTASGGVTCNRELRRALALACSRRGWTLRMAGTGLCTDNAGMVALLAGWQVAAGCEGGSGAEEPLPGWSLEEVASGRGCPAGPA